MIYHRNGTALLAISNFMRRGSLTENVCTKTDCVN